MSTIGGIVCARNFDSLDYCAAAAIQSLLPVCDSVLVCDSDSSDGSAEKLAEMAAANPKIKLINYPWPNPVAKSYHWWTDWINFAREHLTADFQLQLDADEVLHENSYDEIRRAAEEGPNTALLCHRHNFWKDLHHLCPIGRTCSHLVVRFGPQRCWMSSDEIHPEGEPEIRQLARPSNVEIFHYGFIRKKEAMFAKCRVVLQAHFGRYDERLEEAEKHPDKEWWEFAKHDIPLREYRGSHPTSVHQWLIEHGFDPKQDVS